MGSRSSDGFTEPERSAFSRGDGGPEFADCWLHHGVSATINAGSRGSISSARRCGVTFGLTVATHLPLQGFDGGIDGGQLTLQSIPPEAKQAICSRCWRLRWWWSPVPLRTGGAWDGISSNNPDGFPLVPWNGSACSGSTITVWVCRTVCFGLNGQKTAQEDQTRPLLVLSCVAGATASLATVAPASAYVALMEPESQAAERHVQLRSGSSLQSA